jgi:hypothetical protein
MAQPDHVHLEPHSADGHVFFVDEDDEHVGLEKWTKFNWGGLTPGEIDTLTPARFSTMEEFLTVLAQHTVEMSSYSGNIDSENSEFGSMFDVDDSLTQLKISNKPRQDGETIGYWDGNYSEDDEVFEVFAVTHTGPRNTFFVETKDPIARPAVYKGIPNSSGVLLNQLYVDELMPEAVEYIAGLYMHFYDVVNHPPILASVTAQQAAVCVYNKRWNPVFQALLVPPQFWPIISRELVDRCQTPKSQRWINGVDGSARITLNFGADYGENQVEGIPAEPLGLPTVEITADDLPKSMRSILVRIGGLEVLGVLDADSAVWTTDFTPPTDGSLDGKRVVMEVTGDDQAPHFEGYWNESDEFVERDLAGDELDTEPSCLAVAGQNQPYDWKQCPGPAAGSYVPGTDTRHALMIDVTPPTMALVSAGVDDQNRTVAVYEVSDATSGLEVINVLQTLNATVVIDPDPVTPGDKMALVTITVVDRTLSAHVSLQTEDVAGNPYDPSVVIPVMAIKRGPSLPPVNPQSQGLTPVAVLSDADFGPGELDLPTLLFGPGESSPELPGNRYNPNRYRNRDLMLNFSTENAAIGHLDTDVCLIGRTLVEAFVVSCQAIRTVGNPGGLADDFEPVSSVVPENECQCVPHKVTPGRNLATLKKTSSLGRGSTQTKKVGVVLKARERTRGACRPGSNTDTFSLRLHMVDDDGDVILDEIRTGLTCDRRIRQQKFMAPYGVENCAGSEAPSRSSAGRVTVTATTGDGKLVASRTLKCKK